MKVQERIMRAIEKHPGNIVLRSDFSGLGSVTQVSKVLKILQTQGVLIRISTGVYTKTRKSSVTGAIIPAGSLETLAVEAFRRLGVSIGPGSAATAYNSGESPQLPGTFVVNTGRRRITRKIMVGGRSVVYEHDGSGKA